MQNCACFSAIASKEKIDAEKGVISGVSVITQGEAAGRNSGTFIDHTTLSQIHRVAQSYKDGIKVKLSQSKEHDGSAGQIVGVLKNFSIDGDRVRADLHLLKSDDNFNKIIEMSQTMPSEFGLSIVIPKEIENLNGKECLRCSEIYSIDLVEAPAANPSGLFSSKTMSKEIKFANGKDGDHDAECECKACMSKNSKKEMTAFMASALGLDPAKTSEADIVAAFKASRSGDTSELTNKITALTAKLESLEKADANAVALSQKAEIDNLMAEAAKDGKVVPLDADDLYTVKDSVVSIKTLPTQLSKMIQKLPRGQVKLSKKEAELPKDKEGKAINRHSPEFKQFCREAQERGAAELSARFSEIPSLN